MGFFQIKTSPEGLKFQNRLLIFDGKISQICVFRIPCVAFWVPIWLYFWWFLESLEVLGTPLGDIWEIWEVPGVDPNRKK